MSNLTAPATLRSTLLARAASVFGVPVDWQALHAAEAAKERPGLAPLTPGGRP